MNLTLNTNWITLAIASGLAAATNGVFAKLVTTRLTSSLSSAIALLFSLPADSKVVDFIVRAIFFGLNLLANAVMWGLFTAALTRGSSATKVSIINTSANFMFTAVLGWMIFSESLPLLWWVGAAMMVAGSTITGRQDDGVAKPDDTVLTDAPPSYERVAQEDDVERAG